MHGAFGHNSGAHRDDLRDSIETILSDDHEATFRYAQWHIGDYITGTLGMQLEEEGAYIRFLMRLYQRGKPLPDDDRYMATCMNLSIRVWKRVKESLIAIGKIIAKAGCLTNARFEKERRQRAETVLRQAEAARIRWQRQRAEKMGLAEVSGKFAGSLEETSAKVLEFPSEKSNEINGSSVTDHMLTNNQYPLTIEDKPPVVPPRGDERPRRKRETTPEEYPQDFEAFWKVFPRREGKGAAFRFWQRLSMPQKRRAYASLKRQLAELETRQRDPRGNFCPLPATWINQGRFDDELQAAEPPSAARDFLSSVVVPATKPRPVEEAP